MRADRLALAGPEVIFHERWLTLGFGVAGAMTLAVGIPMFVKAKRRTRVSPYVRGEAAGVIFSGAF